MWLSGQLIRILRLYLLFSATILLSGCTVPLAVHIFNNTGDSITITKVKSNRDVDTYVFGHEESLKLDNWKSSKYKFLSGGKSITIDPYSISIPNVGYVKFKGIGPLGSRNAYLQVEKDRRVFLLKKDQKFPMTDFSDQPTGFPIFLDELNTIKKGRTKNKQPNQSLTIEIE